MSRGLPPRLLTRAVEVIRPSFTTDRYGNKVADWANATTTTYRGWVAPTDASEDDHDRDERRIDAKVFLPSGTDLDAGDRVRIDAADTYDVIGPAMAFSTPRGPHHLEAAISLVEG